MKRNHLFNIIFSIIFFSLLLCGLTSQNSSILASNRSQAISIPTNSRSDVSKYQNISYFTQINETKDNKDILDYTSFDSHNLISQMNHQPISITNDLGFNSEGFIGSGTEINPFILANYEIINSSSSLIHIENTSSISNHIKLKPEITLYPQIVR